MGIKAFKGLLSILLCITLIPVLQTDYAWGIEPDTLEEELTEEELEDSLEEDLDVDPEEGTEEEGELVEDPEEAEGNENPEIPLADDNIEDSDLEEIVERDETENISALNEETVQEKSVSPQASTYSVAYKAHVSGSGWQGWVKNGARAGTVGKARSIEALNLKLEGTGYSGAIQYRTHVAGSGWQEYKTNGALSGTTGKALRTEAITINLTGEIAQHYDIYYRVHSSSFGWLNWTSGGKDAGTTGYGYAMEAVEIKLYKKGDKPSNMSGDAFKKKPMSLEARAHVSSIGWQDWKADGKTAGTTGRALQMEALCLQVTSPDYSGSIEYNVHAAGIGWQGYKKNGAAAGSTGRSLAMEAFQVRLTGELAKNYDVYYRVHASGIGWLGWASNDQVAGIPYYCSRIEAVEVKLVKKGGKAPGSTANHTASLSYSSQGHSAKAGWLSKGSGSRIVGTTGKSQSLQGIKLWIDNSSLSGGIEYEAHIGGMGWQGYKKNGTLSGTEGQNRSMEAVKIKLTGDVSKYFDVYYRAHISGWGWLGWTKNGGKAGTTKNGIPMEAVQIKIVAKGAAAPGSTSGAYWETEPIPATYRAMNAKVAGLSSPTGWLIAIDSRNCLVGVYSGSQGNWTNRYMWLCSPGAASTPTVKGIYSIGMRGYVFGSGYSCYWWTQFYGDYLFHSVLYYPGTNRIMEGTMGVPASQGCVRLDIANAKWIHDKIPSGTTVLSY